MQPYMKGKKIPKKNKTNFEIYPKVVFFLQPNPNSKNPIHFSFVHSHNPSTCHNPKEAIKKFVISSFQHNPLALNKSLIVNPKKALRKRKKLWCVKKDETSGKEELFNLKVVPEPETTSSQLHRFLGVELECVQKGDDLQSMGIFLFYFVIFFSFFLCVNPLRM